MERFVDRGGEGGFGGGADEDAGDAAARGDDDEVGDGVDAVEGGGRAAVEGEEVVQRLLTLVR